MHLAPTWLVVLLSVSSAACLRSTAFRCETNDDCSGGGTCAAVGYCSFPDPACASGARFGESAGTFSNQCVGDQPIADAGVNDSSGVDAAIDAPISVGCPAGYAEITGGQGNHRYRLISSTANWTNQRNLCAATSGSAYLAIPNDAVELAALGALAAATTRFWIGLTDAATEMTWLTVKGDPAPYLSWENGQPDDSNPGEDCAASNATEMRDERCNNTQLWAICECEP